MSQFASELEALMQEKGIRSAAELSKLSGVDPATLSRVRSGTQQISHDDLDKISVALGDSPAGHARLLSAKLLEELRPPGGERIKISLLDGDPPRPRAIVPGPRLTPKNQRILQTLANNIGDTELRNILSSLANLCDRGSLAGVRIAEPVSSEESDAEILGSVKKRFPRQPGSNPQK